MTAFLFGLGTGIIVAIATYVLWTRPILRAKIEAELRAEGSAIAKRI